MLTAARRSITNALSGASIIRSANGHNVNLISGCYMRKLTRTTNGNKGGLKAAVTTALLFIMGALYCLYNSAGGSVTFSHQSLGSSNVAGVQPDVLDFIESMDGDSLHPSISSDTNDGGQPEKKKKKIKSSNSGSRVITAADMYEPGFRIKNEGLCSPRTRLLVLITSASAPAHSQNRQAIRMTWMNRYGPGVSMAFFVGTPQMSVTDPVAQVLKGEEQVLWSRLSGKNINKDQSKEKINFKSSAGIVSGASDVFTNQVDVDPGLYRILREPSPGEGLDDHAMTGLNEAEQAVQRVLGREYGRYGDIIQCHSRDTYTNLTLKSIAALEWTHEYCPWAQYLLKTDDDMFIDIHRLLRFIDKVETEAIKESGISRLHSQPQNPMDLGVDASESASISEFDIELPPTIWGRLAHGWRPIRQRNSKYYVSRTQYTSRVYPDFCTGPAYLMTRSAVIPLYEAALGRDFDVIDDEDEDNYKVNGNAGNKDSKNNNKFGKNCNSSNQMLTAGCNEVVASNVNSGRNIVPYLKLEDVYLTGVVAERLTRRAAERLARKERKKKEKILLGINESNQKKTKSKTTDIIVTIRRIHNDQFANKKITGRALDRAVCSGVSPSDTASTGGSNNFSWFRWYWGDTELNKELKKKKKDQGVISLHMVKYFEQFDLWRRLMDGRTKCKS